MAALSYAVSSILRERAEPDMKALLGRIFREIDIPDKDWTMSYHESYRVDGVTVYANWGGVSFTPRAAARVGQLMLQKGHWNGKTVLREDLVEAATTPVQTVKPDRKEDPANSTIGLCWASNSDGVVPSLDLVVVRNGAYLTASGEGQFWGDIVRYILQPVVSAATLASAGRHN